MERRSATRSATRRATPVPAFVRDRGTAFDIGVEAYTYLYPLVLMELTRRQMTNVARVGELVGRAPANAFVHLREFPPAGFRDVVRPNFDTLYSLAWLDVRREPVIVSTPDAGDHYYLLPMYDMWSDVFASPGTRTTGNGAGDFAVVDVGWNGRLPDGVRRIVAPTPSVWVIGRTQCNGPPDYAHVNRFQDRLELTPLSAWGGEPPPPPLGTVDPAVDGETPPPVQVERLAPLEFFLLGAELLKVHPPHTHDHAIVHRLERIGLIVGESFHGFAAPAGVRDALIAAAAEARFRMHERAQRLGWRRNGWMMNTETMGAWGTDYAKRAAVDRIGLSANTPEDSIYPLTTVDSQGARLDGVNRYALRFELEELPPVRAFWSLTAYDDDGYVVPNAAGRYALSDREPLVRDEAGAVDLLIQADPPHSELAANWLPAPPGRFNLCLRLYYPRPEALDGTWAPPGVRRTGGDHPHGMMRP